MKYIKLFIFIAMFSLSIVGFKGSAHAMSLSQTSVSLSQGQTTTVYAYNTYNFLYISNNSNSNVATATLSGNNVSIYGNSTGSTTLTLCESNTNSCTSVYVTVNSTYNYNGNNSGLNISTITLPIGSSTTLTSSFSNNLYISGNTNPSIASTSVSSLPAGCVAGAQYSVTTGQPCYYNNYSNYYQNNTGSVVITALAVGNNTITVCQNYNNSNCNTLYVVVTNNYPIYSYNYPTSSGSVLGAETCYFSKRLRIGMTGADVYCLQSRLLSMGYLSNQYELTSIFDSNTQRAVMDLQRENYLSSDGIVGTLTRNLLF